VVALKNIWDKVVLIFLKGEYGMKHLGKAAVKFSSTLGLVVGGFLCFVLLFNDCCCCYKFDPIK